LIKFKHYKQITVEDSHLEQESTNQKKKKKKLMQLNDLASKKKKGPLNQGEISRILWHEKQLHFPAPQKNIASKHSN